MPEVHLSSAFYPVLLIAAAIVSVALAVFAYRTTIPPVPPARRWMLTGLRAAALFLLFLLIGEPLATFIHRSDEPPAVLILLDNSQSMAIRDRSGDRRQELRSVLQSDAVRTLVSSGAVIARFDRTVRPLTTASPDSLTLQGSLTDIAGAIRDTRPMGETKNIRAIVLVTDGVVTEGADPVSEAEASGLPVFTVGIGDSLEQKDLIVRSVLTNDITYVGNRVPVQVTLHSAGYSGERVEVRLRAGDATVDRATLTLDAGSRDYRVPLSFVAQAEGKQKLSVEVSDLPGELTTANNHAVTFIRVLKSRMSVTLLTGPPSEDVAFIRRSLAADPNVSLQVVTLGRSGAFPGETVTPGMLDTVDCIVLAGLPVAETPAATIGLVRQAGERGTPLLFLASRTIDPQKLQLLAPVLPVTLEQPLANELPVFVSVPDRQRENAIMRVTGDGATDIWGSLPPVFRWQAGYRAKAESDVLAFVRFQRTTLRDPLIVSRSVNRRKSLAVTAYGLWRWDMLADTPPSSTPVLDAFISNSIRWLTTREEDRRVRVQPVREQVTSADPVEFTGQVYDESYRPVDDAQVTVTLRAGGRTIPVALTSAGDGRYAGSSDPLPEGDYTFTATASSGGRTIGEDRGAFSVGGVNAEFLETRMDRSLLERLAVHSGGRFYDANSIGDLPRDIRAMPSFAPREQVHTSELALWNSPWMLMIVVLLFSCEWLFRKLWGMI